MDVGAPEDDFGGRGHALPSLALLESTGMHQKLSFIFLISQLPVIHVMYSSLRNKILQKCKHKLFISGLWAGSIAHQAQLTGHACHCVLTTWPVSKKRDIFSLRYFALLQSFPEIKICLGSFVNVARAEKHSL